MDVDPATLLGIAVMAAVTLATRLAGVETVRLLRLPPRARAILHALAPAVLAGIVFTALAEDGLREAAAITVAGAAVLLRAPAAAALLAAMGLAAAWVALR